LIDKEQHVTLWRLRAFQFLWLHRRLILNTTRNDIRARYTGSVLGLTWAVINPLLLLSVYVILYVFILRIRLPGRVGGSALEYTLVIFAGLIPWFGFAEATTNSLGAVVGNASLIQNTSFPAPVLPVKAVLGAMVGQAVGLSLLLPVLGWTHHLSVYWLFLPLAFATQLLFSLGLGWILAVLNVFVRDLAQAVSAFLLFLMFVSPIAFTSELVAGSRLRFLIELNPVSHLIELYRMPLVYGRAPSLLSLAVGPLLALLLFQTGYRFFVRIRPHLADHV
jgi:lipopolysaccharide transport system permease protein